jgi:hypothetical protein
MSFASKDEDNQDIEYEYRVKMNSTRLQVTWASAVYAATP